MSQTDFRVVRRCSLNDDQSRQDESGSLGRIATLRGLLIHGLTTVLLAAAAAGDPPVANQVVIFTRTDNDICVKESL